MRGGWILEEWFSGWEVDVDGWAKESEGWTIADEGGPRRRED